MGNEEYIITYNKLLKLTEEFKEKTLLRDFSIRHAILNRSYLNWTILEILKNAKEEYDKKFEIDIMSITFDFYCQVSHYYRVSDYDGFYEASEIAISFYRYLKEKKEKEKN